MNDNEPPDIHYCNIHKKYCIHADYINNKEIGYRECKGEYCTNSEDDLRFEMNGCVRFGENEILNI